MNAFSGEPILSVTPADLAPLSRWVAWQTENRKGKPTKVPYDPVRLGKHGPTRSPHLGHSGTG